jgi:hypothetical protein
MGRDYFRQLASDAVGVQHFEQLELHAPRRFRAVVGQVYDLALLWTFNRGMRLVGETSQSLGEPVIAAGLLELTVHALLYNNPVAVVGDDEAVQVQLEPVLHGGTVDLGYQAAGCGERGPIKAHPVPDIDQFVRRLPRIPAASAAYMDPRAPALEEPARASTRR